MVNVKDFNAVGDGVADDTAAIQAALDSGEVVRFPAGVYNSNTIYLRSNGGLHLEEGAVLRAIADKNKCNPDDFPLKTPSFQANMFRVPTLLLPTNAKISPFPAKAPSTGITMPFLIRKILWDLAEHIPIMNSLSGAWRR